MPEQLVPLIGEQNITRRILRKFDLKAKKGLGQNFLINPRAINEIVQLAEIQSGEQVLEIGPGIGTLTQALALAGAKVTSVELDERMLPVLAETLQGLDCRIVHGDILQVNLRELMGEKPFKVVANLPYYITTPIILQLLESSLPIERLVTMVQKEVAERMAALPGGKEYGALSVAVQFRATAKMPLIVQRESFLPVPKVDSAVVVCKMYSQPPIQVVGEQLFFRVVRAAFSQRRKMLSNCLKTLGLDSDRINQWLNKAGVDGKRRAETLSLQEFAKLTNSYQG